jgi:cob(I)alamin adenosyltransferase
MDSGEQARRLRSFLIGGVVGASAAMAAARRRRRRRERRPVGLAAFEEAPCYKETLEDRREAAS